MTSSELDSFIGRELNYPDSQVVDAKYSLIDKDCFFDECARILQTDLFSFRARYRKEVFDCDDFALLTVAILRLAYANTKDRPEGTALAVGYMFYESEQGPHAIIFAVCRSKSGERELVFMEPQTQLEITLTKDEKASTRFYYV